MTTNVQVLIKQSCPQGLTGDDLAELFGDGERLREFNHWMRGQTMSVCDGREYNYAEKRYQPTKCAGHPHGVVAYPWDVERFLLGLPVID
jgi:hypothetical protein